jgi:hypothetical protein
MLYRINDSLDDSKIKNVPVKKKKE